GIRYRNVTGVQTCALPIYSEDGSEFDPVLSETKPDVAEVPVNNQPNRIITTINGDTSSEMGFSWYTSDLFEDAKVWVSKTGEFDDALEFDAEAKEVASSYGERDEMETIYSPKWRKMQKASLLKMEMASLSSTATIRMRRRMEMNGCPVTTGISN